MLPIRRSTDLVTHGNSSYYFFPTEDLPLFDPLRSLGVPEPVIDVVEPFFRVIVELGYDRSIHPWEPTPARLIPTLNPAGVTADLVDAIGEGVNNAAALFGSPAPLSIPAPATTGQVTPDQPPVDTDQPTPKQKRGGTDQLTPKQKRGGTDQLTPKQKRGGTDQLTPKQKRGGTDQLTPKQKRGGTDQLTPGKPHGGIGRAPSQPTKRVDTTTANPSSAGSPSTHSLSGDGSSGGDADSS